MTLTITTFFSHSMIKKWNDRKVRQNSMEYYNPRLLVIVKSTAMYFIPTFLHLYYIINYVICINKPEVEPSRAGGQLGLSSLWVTLSPSQIDPSSFLSPHTFLSPTYRNPTLVPTFFFPKHSCSNFMRRIFTAFMWNIPCLEASIIILIHLELPALFVRLLLYQLYFQLMSPHFSDCCFINNEGSTTQIKVVRFLDSKDEIKPTHIIHLIKSYM